MNTRIVIFAKAPQPGLAKTRLIPALGAEGAAALARQLLQYTLAQAIAAEIGTVELCMSPFDESAWQDVPIPASVVRTDQGEGDLGERMARASERVIAAGDVAMLIGTDCPALDAMLLRQIAQHLAVADTVLLPTADGGYAALALQRFDASLFSGIAWSTDSVARETLCRIGQLGWSVHQLPIQHDIDEPADLRWLPAGSRT